MHQLHCLPPKLIKFSENPFVETWEFELSPDLGRIPLVSCTYLTLQSSPHRLTASTKRTVEVLKKRRNHKMPTRINRTKHKIPYISYLSLQQHNGTISWNCIINLYKEYHMVSSFLTHVSWKSQAKSNQIFDRFRDFQALQAFCMCGTWCWIFLLGFLCAVFLLKLCAGNDKSVIL